MKKIVMTIMMFLGLASSGAFAAPLLDQYYEIGMDVADGPFRDGTVVYDDNNFNNSVAQTFTVGIGGELTGVAIQIGRYFGTGGTLGVDILGTSSGIPTGSSLASASLAWSSLPDWDVNIPSAFVFVDLSSFNLSVLPGDVLAIALSVLSGPDPQSTWDGYWQGQYSGGIAFSTWRSGFWEPQVLSDGQGGLLYGDMGFRTFVDPNTNQVPEPSTWMLIVSGLAGLAVLRKRFKV